MSFTKHKKLLFTVLFLTATMAGFFFFAGTQTAQANHDQCFGLSALGTDTAKCTADKRDAANRACFVKHEGNNTAIASCVEQVTAHYTASPETAPALPRDLESSLGSTTNVTTIGDCKVGQTEELSSENCAIVKWINLAINVLSVLVGIVVTIMIIAGGIQYISAREDPNAVAKAKKQIFSAVFALVIYGLLYAFLDYFIPGGIIQ